MLSQTEGVLGHKVAHPRESVLNSVQEVLPIHFYALSSAYSRSSG